MLRLLFLGVLLICLSGCDSESNIPDHAQSDPNSTDSSLVKDVSLATVIEQSHNKLAFTEKENVSCDIVLEYGGKTVLNGKMTFSTDSKNGKIEYTNGDIIIFNDDKVYCKRGMNGTSARFSAYTWSYFFMFPYKLSDPGTNWKTYEKDSLKQQAFNAQKLTFDSGVGDAPEDWYIVYSDKDSHLINTAAYIVTAGSNLEEAEKDPHAIEYCDYAEIAGIPVATTWRFWGWQADKGLTNQLGNAQISNIKFHTVSEDFYTADSPEVTLVPVPAF